MFASLNTTTVLFIYGVYIRLGRPLFWKIILMVLCIYMVARNQNEKLMFDPLGTTCIAFAI